MTDVYIHIARASVGNHEPRAKALSNYLVCSVYGTYDTTYRMVCSYDAYVYSLVC